MTYQETLDFLYHQLPMFQKQGATAYKEDLGNIIELCEVLGNPQNQFKSIHIGGTNGKGSVSKMLTSVFMEAGYRVGTYTSPHYIDFRERIQINGRYIPQLYVTDFVNTIKEEIPKLRPSFFEITVAMAFDYFAKEEVDVAIIEVGLGGRLDSTNIIKPELSIITNIGYDHQKFLGNTLEKIAEEKAGIIKKGAPVVIGKTQKDTANIFIEKAKQETSEIFFADQLVEVSRCDEQLEIKNSEESICFQSNIQGTYQLENLATSYTAFQQLMEEWKLSQGHFIEGIQKIDQNSPLIGRWQIIDKAPLTILDSSHNEAGISAFLEEIQSMEYNDLHIIYGTVSDKDVASILHLFPKESTTYYITAPSVQRKMPVEQLSDYFENQFDYKKYSTGTQALVAARENAQVGDIIVVFGSIFLVADVLKKH